jgi:hypothetical protein
MGHYLSFDLSNEGKHTDNPQMISSFKVLVSFLGRHF